MQTQYLNAAQAGAELRAHFASNPVTSIRKIDPAEPIQGQATEQYRVHWEVYKREGSTVLGEFIVQDTHTPQKFVIVQGSV